MKYEISIEGMGCEMCVKKVTKALETLGAQIGSVEIGKAVCDFSGETSALREAIEDAGFDVISVDAK